MERVQPQDGAEHTEKSILDYETLCLDEAEKSLVIIDQTKLPNRTELLHLKTQEEICNAIRLLQVRGAPAIGDAAAVLFTTGFTDRISYSLLEPVATLPLAIFFQLGSPLPEVQQRAYAGALILTVMILGLSLAARGLAARCARHAVK